jgi:ubiquinone/menaquinone biosynthesis C-methylase UbiE
VNLPFESQTYDIVIGIAVLHHLSEPDVSKALSEAYRVLNKTGMAVFFESVENSKLFDFIQNLFPAGKRGSRWYRPSILQRRAWNDYLSSVDDRDMTNRELVSEGKKHFRSVRISPYGFLIRLERLIGKNYAQNLQRLDDVIFRMFPPLRWLSQSVVVEYRK